MLKHRRKVRLNGKRKRLSHVVWHDHTGHWPEWPEVVHHIDGDKTNDVFENLQLMSVAEHTALHQTGANQSEETRRRMSAARKGKIFSEEHKANIRTAAIERWKNPEYRAKISAANMGENNPSWKGDAATSHSKYTRIQRAKRRVIHASQLRKHAVGRSPPFRCVNTTRPTATKAQRGQQHRLDSEWPSSPSVPTLSCPPDCPSKRFCDPSSCALESVREANAIVEALRRAE